MDTPENTGFSPAATGPVVPMKPASNLRIFVPVPTSNPTPAAMRSVCPWRKPPSRLRGIAIWMASALLTPGVTTPRTESGFQARIRMSGTELSAASNRNTPCPSATSERGRRNRRSCCWASTSLTTIPTEGRNPSAKLTPSARSNPSTPCAAESSTKSRRPSPNPAKDATPGKPGTSRNRHTSEP